MLRSVTSADKRYNVTPGNSMPGVTIIVKVGLTIPNLPGYAGGAGLLSSPAR